MLIKVLKFRISEIFSFHRYKCILFLGVTQEEIDDKRVETEKQMLDDLKRWAAEGRDIDRDYKDINGATPVSSLGWPKSRS